MTVKDPPVSTSARASAYTDDALETMAEARVRWERAQAQAAARRPYWKDDFTTVSSMEVPHLTTPEEVADIEPLTEIGVPGEFPFTRGVHPTGYRGKLWTMRQFAGFGSAEDTNARFKYLLDHGFEVIPVNPTVDEILGQKSYASLTDIPRKVDMVDCFRRSEQMPALARQAVDIGARVLWMQLSVINDEAREIAEAAGLSVIMDRCAKIEYARIFGGLNWAGVNTRIISARRPRHITL